MGQANPAYRGNEPYVFVCYAHADKPIVYSYIDWLQQNGINVWYDEGISPGVEWSEELGLAIDGARWLLFFATSASIESRHCRNEVLFAHNHATPTLTIYLEPVELPVGLELTLSGTQAISYEGKSEEFRRSALLDAISGDQEYAFSSSRRSKRPPLRRRMVTGLLVSIVLSGLFLAAAELRLLERLGISRSDDISFAARHNATIAVLPFMNLSGDADLDFFSDGLSDELLSRLAQLPNLRVAARTSSFFFKGQTADLEEIGRTLGVRNVVEGSVRKVGAKVRVNAQLISVEDGFSRWSKTFDTGLEGFFDVQEEISQEIAQALQLSTSRGDTQLSPSATTRNIQAHELYLRANQALYRRSLPEVEQAIELYRRAIELDPGYAPPLVGLAEAVHALMNNYGTISREEALEVSRDALDKALALGYETSDYWATLGLHHHHLIPDDVSHRRLSADFYEKAIRLNPNNVDARVWHASLLSDDVSPPDLAGAARLLDDAAALDPLNRILQNNRQLLKARMGRQDEAIDRLRELIELDPDYPSYRNALAVVYVGDFRFLEAANLLPDIVEARPNVPWWVLYMLQTLGGPDLVAKYSDTHAEAFAREMVFAAKASEDELLARTNELLRSPDPEQLGRFVTYRHLESRNYRAAKQLLENMHPGFDRTTPDLDVGQSDIAILYLEAIHGLGDPRATSVATSLLQSNVSLTIVGLQGKGINDAICQLVLGDLDSAIEEIEAAYDAGWRGFFGERIAHRAMFDAIISEPRVQSVRARNQAWLAKDRDQILDILRDLGLLRDKAATRASTASKIRRVSSRILQRRRPEAPPPHSQPT